MKVALLGFGVVGSGAYETIKDTRNMEVVKVLELRERPEIEHMRTTDINDILNDKDIDLVAECMGGIHPAMDFVIDAMNHGKHVVTPNKAMISAHYDELMEVANRNNVEIRYTPAAGGGIPWLYNLRRSKRCDRIQEVHGIVNGTCNYILDNMHTNGSDFGEVLKEAQALGYAERDPSADIEGHDTLRKLVISSNIAFDTDIKEEEIPVIGINKITATDIEYFNNNSLVCRLLMNAGIIDGKVYAYVEPTLLTGEALEANTKTNFNLITLTGANVGTLSFYGQGAGKMPTGASLVQDMIDINEKIEFVEAATATPVAPGVDNTMVCKQYYFNVAADAAFPEELVETKTMAAERALIITKEMTVEAAHKLAAELDCFAAGIRA